MLRSALILVVTILGLAALPASAQECEMPPPPPPVTTPNA